MSRRLLLVGSECLQKAAAHGQVAARLPSGLCRRCLVSPTPASLSAVGRRQMSTARGLREDAAASWDATRRQRPDMLYSRVMLELRAHDPAVLDSYVTFLRQAARHLDVTVHKVFEPPRHYNRMSLLKSVHIFAKHKVQYEVRTYFRVVELHRLTGSTADTYLEYCQRMLPEAVAMKVTRHAREPLPEHLSRRPDAAPAAEEGDGAPPATGRPAAL